MFYGNGNRKLQCAALTKLFFSQGLMAMEMSKLYVKQTPEGLNTNEHGGVSIAKFHRDGSPTNLFFLVYLGVLCNV